MATHQKPFAAVRLEGTIVQNADPDVLDFGTIREGVKERLASLQRTHDVLILSSAIKWPNALRLLNAFLRSNGLEFYDIWGGDGLPTAELWIDDEARKL